MHEKSWIKLVPSALSLSPRLSSWQGVGLEPGFSKHFPVKGQIINVLGFVGQLVSVGQ